MMPLTIERFQGGATMVDGIGIVIVAQENIDRAVETPRMSPDCKERSGRVGGGFGKYAFVVLSHASALDPHGDGVVGRTVDGQTGTIGAEPRCIFIYPIKHKRVVELTVSKVPRIHVEQIQVVGLWRHIGCDG